MGLIFFNTRNYEKQKFPAQPNGLIQISFFGGIVYVLKNLETLGEDINKIGDLPAPNAGFFLVSDNIKMVRAVS